MLDQTFSAQNFRRVYDIENRRGRNVDRAFFPALVDASARITAASAAIRAARRANFGVADEALNAILQPLREVLRAERAERESLVDTTMEEVAQAVFDGYQIQLDERDGPNDTTLYTLPSDPRPYFIGKQIQHNISRLYKLKAGNRRAIVSQLFDQLNTGFRQVCVRTDISGFYENIDRASLARELDTDQLLSFGSKKYIKQALASYGVLSQSAVGIPRGLGVSAFLSELYMRSIDERIKQLPGVSYYARYVDDIVIIFSPTADNYTKDYLNDIDQIIKSKHLSLNPVKTKWSQIGTGQLFNFDYLGYHFSIAAGVCEVSMGQRKFLRYRERINRAFAAYVRQATFDQKGAARMLAARIKFMTGNTRLINNKRHAYTGIYFNNSHLTNLGRLRGLDQYLAYKISKIESASLQNRLDLYSFFLGFTERRFARYSTKELAQIVEAWRYEA
jgi:hypothetical protein